MCGGGGAGSKARDEGFRSYKKGGVQKSNLRKGIGIKLIGKDLLKKREHRKSHREKLTQKYFIGKRVCVDYVRETWIWVLSRVGVRIQGGSNRFDTACVYFFEGAW